MTFTMPNSSNACGARHSPTCGGRRAAGRESPLLAPGRRPGPDDPDARSSQMLLFFARCRDGARHGGARPGAASRPTLSKQPDAPAADEKPQPARIRSDPKSFVLCPYNGRGSAAAPHDRAGRRRLQPLVSLRPLPTSERGLLLQPHPAASGSNHLARQPTATPNPARRHDARCSSVPKRRKHVADLAGRRTGVAK